MIITKLSGGVGNQLFQFAAGFRLSQKHRVPLKLDITEIEQETNRFYRLDNFEIKAQLATKAEIEYLTRKRIYGRRYTLHLILQNMGLLHLPRSFQHLKSSFCSELLDAGGQCYLNGYWQSEKYFKDVAKELRLQLRFKRSVVSNISNLALVAENTKSLSIHIRRGDYVSVPAIQQKHGTCSIDYYHHALNHLRTIAHIEQVFIFSDDPLWVRQNLRIDLPTIIATEHTSSEIEDLALMSHCKYHIIANSSFSWWGAWLSDAAHEFIVAPQKWFNDHDHDYHEIVPKSWTRI